MKKLNWHINISRIRSSKIHTTKAPEKKCCLGKFERDLIINLFSNETFLDLFPLLQPQRRSENAQWAKLTSNWCTQQLSVSFVLPLYALTYGIAIIRYHTENLTTVTKIFSLNQWCSQTTRNTALILLS